MADLNLNVNENVNANEHNDAECGGLCSYDTIGMTELPALQLDPPSDIFLFVFGGISIDSTQVFMNDIVIELELPFEDIVVTESAVLGFDKSLPELFELLTVTEFATITDGLYFISIFEHTFITESVTLVKNPNILLDDDGEELIVDEFVSIIFDPFLDISDSLIITENVSLAKEILEVSVVDFVGTSNFVLMGLSVFPLFVYDEVLGITEFITGNIEFAYEFTDFLRSYPFVEETKHQIVVQEFENGSEQRRDKWGRTKKRFTITFEPRTKSEATNLKEFFNLRSASQQVFDFTSPLDGVTYSCRFEANTLLISRIAFSIYSAQFSIVEVF
jgi:hypothetical protein